MFFDLHRHDEASSFDGFGRTENLVKQAKDLGYTALGISNHGNTNTLVRHYFACKNIGIKPVLGVETYFLPKINEEKKRRGYHLCLFAKNIKGYENINKLQYEGEKQKYYNPIVTFENLKKYNEGIICTTACVASIFSQMILKNKIDKARKYLLRFKNIFKDDLYIEIQPYKISEVGMQEKVNKQMMKLAKELNIKCILTSDSHYGLKQDFDTYLKMHEISKHDLEHIRDTYKERYMPTEEEIIKRFIEMHPSENALKKARRMVKNSQEINDKVEEEILEKLEHGLPTFDEKQDSYKLLIQHVKQGLKERGKYNKEYINRAKEELEVIKYHKFQDYFLIVEDYVRWAKNNNIMVGPGRGSGCNCLINYALAITDVDPIYFDLEFRRFLRIDKKKMPDIDLDFETKDRDKVIEYIINKYPGKSAQICSYGLYKVDNLINDLVKVCGVQDKITGKEIKRHINRFIKDMDMDVDGLLNHKMTKIYNEEYDNIMIHFTKMYGQIRFIGTHAAGVAIVEKDISDYTALRINSKQGKIYTSYDLGDLEKIGVIKFDILGLKSMEAIGNLRRMTGTKGFKDEWVEDKKILKEFNKGNTDGIFQFDREAVKEMLREINCDCFSDIVAASSMNRPGPLSLGMPSIYADNKMHKEHIDKTKPYYKYLKETYGTVVYQEQIQQICVNIGGLEYSEADLVTKMDTHGNDKSKKLYDEHYEDFMNRFCENAKKHNMTTKDSKEIFEAFLCYAFNKGHATGYSLISVELMYYKVYFPLEYWTMLLRFESEETKKKSYESAAVKDGCVILLPHINGTYKDDIVEIDGERVIQEGISEIKGVGEKAAKIIIENGPYYDLPDFEEKMEEVKGQRRVVTKRTIKALDEAGCFEFNNEKFIKSSIKYNIGLKNKMFRR